MCCSLLKIINLRVSIAMTMSPQLFYLVGASGAGKDSLLAAIEKTALPSDRVLVAHRYITRPANSGGENHIALSLNEFTQRAEAGLFLFHWSAHDNNYGIGIEVLTWLKRGFHVLMNGSRAYYPTAQQRYPTIKAIEIRVSPETLQQRLQTRGREKGEAIDQRMSRTDTIVTNLPDDIWRIDNNGTLAESTQIFFEQLRA